MGKLFWFHFFRQMAVFAAMCAAAVGVTMVMGWLLDDCGMGPLSAVAVVVGPLFVVAAILIARNEARHG